FVHGEEGRSHAAARLHELPSTEANPLAADVGQFQHPAFDALLCLTLQRREGLPIGHDLCRDGGCGRNRFSTGHQALFSFREPTTHFRPPFYLVEPDRLLVADAAALDDASLAHNLDKTHSSAAMAPAVLGGEIRFTGIAGCCARAASGQPTTPPPSSVMNARRFTSSMG